MKKSMLLLLTAAGTALFAAPAGQTEQNKKMPPSPPHHRSREHSRRGPLMWMAFSNLSEAERKEMTKLQRNDPEKFREMMMAKVEKLIQAEQAEQQLLKDLAQKYHKAANEQEKKAAADQISGILQKRFEKRLNNNRRQLEAMKQRAKKIEQELNRREKNAEKIIEIQLKAVLEGKSPDAMHKRPGGKLPPPKY